MPLLHPCQIRFPDYVFCTFVIHFLSHRCQHNVSCVRVLHVCVCVFVYAPQDPLLKGQRCVILADGFYEWQQSEKKQPFFIYFPQSKEEGSKETIEVQSEGENPDEAKALEVS